nr:hypothetical protein Iba_chr12cCG3440 [Ipomoea batatas]
MVSLNYLTAATFSCCSSPFFIWRLRCLDLPFLVSLLDKSFKAISRVTSFGFKSCTSRAVVFPCLMLSPSFSSFSMTSSPSAGIITKVKGYCNNSEESSTVTELTSFPSSASTTFPLVLGRPHFLTFLLNKSFKAFSRVTSLGFKF